MSFNICLDGGMILLTPTIEKMIFLSSGCAIFLLFVVRFCVGAGNDSLLNVRRPYRA